jgi:hypothetical protein
MLLHRSNSGIKHGNSGFADYRHGQRQFQGRKEPSHYSFPHNLFDPPARLLYAATIPLNRFILQIRLSMDWIDVLSNLYNIHRPLETALNTN